MSAGLGRNLKSVIKHHTSGTISSPRKLSFGFVLTPTVSRFSTKPFRQSVKNYHVLTLFWNRPRRSDILKTWNCRLKTCRTLRTVPENTHFSEGFAEACLMAFTNISWERDPGMEPLSETHFGTLSHSKTKRHVCQRYKKKPSKTSVSYGTLKSGLARFFLYNCTFSPIKIPRQILKAHKNGNVFRLSSEGFLMTRNENIRPKEVANDIAFRIGKWKL